MAYLVLLAFTFLNVLGAVLPSETFCTTGKIIFAWKVIGKQESISVGRFGGHHQMPVLVGGEVRSLLNKFEQVSIDDHQMSLAGGWMSIPGPRSGWGEPYHVTQPVMLPERTGNSVCSILRDRRKYIVSGVARSRFPIIFRRHDRKARDWLRIKARRDVSGSTSVPSANGSGWAETAGPIWDRNASSVTSTYTHTNR